MTLEPHIRDLLRAAALAVGLPPSLVLAVCWQESGGKNTVVSSRGAVGLMQIMPATAKGLGIDPTDPAQNAEGGARFLASLVRRYAGDVDRALAAYNWGPRHVDNRESLPPSVARYVASVRSLQARFANVPPVPTSGNGAGTGTAGLIAFLLIVVLARQWGLA